MCLGVVCLEVRAELITIHQRLMNAQFYRENRIKERTPFCRVQFILIQDSGGPHVARTVLNYMVISIFK